MEPSPLAQMIDLMFSFSPADLDRIGEIDDLILAGGTIDQLPERDQELYLTFCQVDDFPPEVRQAYESLCVIQLCRQGVEAKEIVAMLAGGSQ